MAGFKILGFAGMAPRVSKANLKDNEAQVAVDTNLLSTELRAWPKPGSLTPKKTIAVGTKSLFRHLDTSGADLWLSWTDDVDVAKSPIYGGTDRAIYLTGNGTPKKTNAALAMLGQYREMGVPNPTTAPTVSATGGSGTAESRAYLYTFATTFGSIEEESGPSPVSTNVNVLPGGTVTVGSLPATAPAGAYGITKVYIYRAVTGTSTTAWLRVGSVAIGTTSFTDNVTASGLGGALSTSTYEPPPADLKGLRLGANGIMAAFRGNELFFSEQFQPHAWPSIYSLTFDANIVSIEPLDEGFVVMTEGYPYVVSGATPGSMTQAKLPMLEPCLSKRSTASDENGVMYVSPNGVMRIGRAGSGLVSDGLFDRETWQKYAPSTMLGEIFAGRYYLFTSKTNFNNMAGCLVFDSKSAGAAFTISTHSTDAVFVDPVTTKMYISQGGEVKEWEGDTINYTPYEWRSKLFILPRPLNFGAVQIDAEFGDVDLGAALSQQAAQVAASNQSLFAAAAGRLLGGLANFVLNGRVLDGSILAPLPRSDIDGRYLTLTVYCNGRQVSQQAITSRRTYRLPSGFKGDRWEVQLNGNIPVRVVKIAETAKELAGL